MEGWPNRCVLIRVSPLQVYKTRWYLFRSFLHAVCSSLLLFYFKKCRIHIFLVDFCQKGPTFLQMITWAFSERKGKKNIYMDKIKIKIKSKLKKINLVQESWSWKETFTYRPVSMYIISSKKMCCFLKKP